MLILLKEENVCGDTGCNTAMETLFSKLFICLFVLHDHHDLCTMRRSNSHGLG